ncbi:MAG: hypothetical protein M1504_02765 [Candidatus Marsarchaeota archaeon]|nr:hypothetical protein [Candidatus Marsarchaeota archaeon]
MQIQNMCPKCGIACNFREEDGKVYMACGHCDYKSEFKNYTVHECKECGYDKAIITFYGVIIGDEPPLQLYKCLKCGFVDREGVS